MKEIIEKIQKELEAIADPEAKESGEKFFKEKVNLRGVTVPQINDISKEYFPGDKSKKEIFELCDELFRTGFWDESIIACNWSYKMNKQFMPGDFAIFEIWVENYIDNWATCDTFCNHTIGSFVEKYPHYLSELRKWTKSKNRWMKRAAAVSLVLPARKGLFSKYVFEIADVLLLDEDDIVQKGYGWMLKEASKANQEEVFEYVLKNKAVMPRTALRYAIEKMPIEMKNEAMARE